LAYFLFVASFGWAGRELLLEYVIIFPWFLLVVIVLNLPFLRLLVGGVKMSDEEEMNHVLEHGTARFLKQQYEIKRGIGGSAVKDGFRLYGVRSKKDIEPAFEKLRQYLKEGGHGAALSRFCGSNVYFMQGLSLMLLTLTFVCFAVRDFGLLYTQAILLSNLVLYLMLKYPVGKYFQKRFTMSFDFSDARIASINKTGEKGVFERSPVFHVRTSIEQRIR